MAPDVFSDDQGVSLEVEDACGEKDAGPRKVALSGAQFAGQIQQDRFGQFHRDRQFDPRKLLANKFDARPAEKKANGCGERAAKNVRGGFGPTFEESLGW